MFEFSVFASISVILTTFFTEQFKDLLNVEGGAGAYASAALMSALVPIVIGFGGEQVVEFIAAFLGESQDIPTPPEGFPVAGYVLSGIINFFGAGGLYNFAKKVMR